MKRTVYGYRSSGLGSYFTAVVPKVDWRSNHYLGNHPLVVLIRGATYSSARIHYQQMAELLYAMLFVSFLFFI